MFDLRNVMITGEVASANQEAGDKFLDAIRKIIQQKGYLPEHVFNADKSVIFWKKKKPQKTFISKEEKRAPGFNAGRDGRSPLFCANAVGFTIRTCLIYKAANP